MTRGAIRIAVALCAMLVMLTLAGCFRASGLRATSRYACQAPDGVACESVSGTYANVLQDTLPSQRRRAHHASPAPDAPAAARSGAPDLLTGHPLRAPPRVLRLWFKPWEDADHDLYDQGYVYVQVDNGRWRVDHAQRTIRDAYVPLRPPLSTPAPPDSDAKPMPGLTSPRAGDAPKPDPAPFPALTLPEIKP